MKAILKFVILCPLVLVVLALYYVMLPLPTVWRYCCDSRWTPFWIDVKYVWVECPKDIAKALFC